MITAKGLQQLGFTSLVDFELQDDLDGKGVYIKEWLSDQPQPSVADIEAADIVWQSIYDSKQYQRDRQYAPTGDQLDMLWHTIDEGGTLDKTSEFYLTNKAVKDASPKP